MTAITPDPEHNWWARQTNPFALTDSIGTHNALKYGDVRDGIPKNTVWEELLKKGEDVPEYWFNMMTLYKQRSSVHWWDMSTRSYKTEYRQDKLERNIYKDLYMLAKPCKAVEVPLGKMCKDNYASWYPQGV